MARCSKSGCFNCATVSQLLIHGELLEWKQLQSWLPSRAKAAASSDCDSEIASQLLIHGELLQIWLLQLCDSESTAHPWRVAQVEAAPKLLLRTKAIALHLIFPLGPTSA